MALVQSEFPFQDILDAIPSAVLLVDAEGIIRFFNDRAESLFGYEREEILGEVVEFLIGTEFREIHARLRQNYMVEPQPRFHKGNLNFIAHHRDGRSFKADIQLNPLLIADEPMIICVVRDITAQAVAEEGLKTNERFLSEAQRVGNIGSWEMDIATGKPRWSDEFFRICGFEPGAFEPTSEIRFEIIHPDDRERVIEAMNAAIANRERYHVENRIIHPDGEIRYVLADGGVVVNEQGKPDKLMGTIVDITERKRVEQALRVSEARFRAVWEQTSDAVALSDAEGIVLMANPAYHQLYGYKPEEVINQNFAIIFPPELREEAKAQYKTVFANETVPPLFESTVQREDGTIRYVETRIDFLYQDGQRVAMLSNIRDVTERKQIIEDLRRSEARLRQAQNVLRLGIWDWEIATDETVWSGDMFRIYGILPNEFTGKGSDYFEFTHPADREIQQKNIELAFARAREQEVGSDGLIADLSNNPNEFRILRPDGTICYVQGDAVAIVDESGQPVRMLGTLLDITERKLAEKVVQESEARYRAITELVADYAYTAVVTPDNNIIADWMTESLQELAGIQLNDDNALTIWQQMIYPEDVDLSNKVLRRILSGHEDVTEMRLRLRDGRLIWIRHYVLPIWSREEGRVVQIHGAIQDITPYKEMETRLGQAQKMEAIGQLAGGVAHDFNNILTAIMNYTDLLLLYFPNEEDKVHERLQQIAQSAERASTLTHQLLAFSRKQVLSPTILNVNEVIINILKMIDRLIGEDVTCVTQLADNLSQVKADRGQLEQVILNLVVNARDAMPGGGEVVLRTADIHIDQASNHDFTDVPPGHYVLLSVSDNGVGMDAATQLRIFEPFFTTKEQGKGTGLGLATVHGIIKQSGGYISVHSTVGQGATFDVYLPAVTETAESFSSSSNTKLTLYGTETILLVEDELFVRESVRDSLTIYGYRVLDVLPEEVALVCQQYAEPIHLLLADIVMPGVNGREVAEQVRQLRPHTKILFMSGYTDDKILQHGVLKPDMPFLQKPFTPDTLVQKVRQVLDDAN